MLIVIKAISTKNKGRLGVCDEQDQWYTAWEFINNKKKEKIPNPAIPYLKVGATVDIITYKNGEYVNIVGVSGQEQANTPPKRESASNKQETGKDLKVETDWPARNRQTDRGMLISYVLEHLVATGKISTNGSLKELVSEWVNHLSDLQYQKAKTDSDIEFGDKK